MSRTLEEAEARIATLESRAGAETDRCGDVERELEKMRLHAGRVEKELRVLDEEYVATKAERDAARDWTDERTTKVWRIRGGAVAPEDPCDPPTPAPPPQMTLPGAVPA